MSLTKAVQDAPLASAPSVDTPLCRLCKAPLEEIFVDLGMSPLANAYISGEARYKMEPFYPLCAYVCGTCLLVQLSESESPAHLFSHYAYFSSYSESWLQHAKQYTETTMARCELSSKSQVIEIASNDGYLLQYFVEKGVTVLGIEPAQNVADVAMKKGIPTVVKFFGADLALALTSDGIHADVLIANNVLAHVPNLNDFVRGLKIVLAPLGVVTIEVPHVARLIAENQFDTIYHEHFSYFSLTVVERLLAAHDLVVFDVEELPTHGGSIRIWAKHAADDTKPVEPRVGALRTMEEQAGLTRLDVYRAFAGSVARTKHGLLTFLIQVKDAGKQIVGYGAPAKGNTLLNYCGIRSDLLDYTVDRSPYKQGQYLPGSRLPIHHPDYLRQTRPDYVLILPWNLRTEVMEQIGYIREWGGQFVVPIPSVQVYS